MSINYKVKLLSAFICFSLLISNLLMHSNAYAFFGKSRAPQISYPFPTTENEFKDKVIEITKQSPEDPLSDFKLKIPNDWTENTYIKTLQGFNTFGTLEKDLTSTITRYEGPVFYGDRPSIEIKKAQLYHEISAKYWLQRYMNLHNYLPLGEIKEINTNEAIASYSYIGIDNLSKKATVRALINGNIMMIAEFVSPTDLEKPLNFLEKEVINSLTLLNITKSSIERTKDIYLSNAAEVKYPESWNLYKIDDENIDNMVIQLHNSNNANNKEETGTVNGIIEIRAVKRNNRTNLNREMKLLRERLEESMDVRFTDVKEVKDLRTNSRFIFSRYESYTANRKDGKKTDKEVHLAVLGDSEWYIIAFLYTPIQSEDSYNWARNIMSFISIIEKII